MESLPEMKPSMNWLQRKANEHALLCVSIPISTRILNEYITTGLNENKFGLNEQDLPKALDFVAEASHLELMGIHFHIGSQITDLCALRICASGLWGGNNGLKIVGYSFSLSMWEADWELTTCIRIIVP